ncbi:MAG: SPOR domain-containing protein [Hydrogenophaga sp.]|uniref:SPOR domain-containing protein n=1 Tax=Hydrogenophaga sp. TaxID=1904254 RepID=UPI003D9AC58B
MKSSKRQHAGGTLVGFVVGLLVGLGIALSVAVYVTRVPVPFVDRGVSRKPAQDIEEAERNKGWNPNAQLAGKPAPLPTPVTPEGTDTAGAISVPPADGQPLPVPTKPAATATMATSKPAATATTATPKPGADPLGDLVASKLGGTPTVSATAAKNSATASTTKGSSTAADPFSYFVQAGAFKSPEDAEAQRAKLAMMGMAADVSEREQSGRTVFRVRLGPFNDKAMADATREQLETNGVEAALVRIQK